MATLFLTIEHALTQVSAGDTVHVMPWVYTKKYFVIPTGVIMVFSMRTTTIQSIV